MRWFKKLPRNNSILAPIVRQSICVEVFLFQHFLIKKKLFFYHRILCHYDTLAVIFLVYLWLRESDTLRMSTVGYCVHQNRLQTNNYCYRRLIEVIYFNQHNASIFLFVFPFTCWATTVLYPCVGVVDVTAPTQTYIWHSFNIRTSRTNSPTRSKWVDNWEHTIQTINHNYFNAAPWFVTPLRGPTEI